MLSFRLILAAVVPPMVRRPRRRHPSPKAPRWGQALAKSAIVAMVGLGLALEVFPDPAQANNVSNFLFGRRENRGGRSPNRQQGGGVRAGRLGVASIRACPT